MKTRQDYLAGNCTHAEYYAQFVTPEITEHVRLRIGEKAIHNSTDPHFNDIPLSRWDALEQAAPFRTPLRNALKAAGDTFSLSGVVCVAKTAACQIKEEVTK